MAANLNTLVPDFKNLVEQLIGNCQAMGVDMRANVTLRDPFTQAKLWRQSRTIEEITDKINEFEAENANFLAHCLSSVGPQQGGHVTNAPPGLSWHQYGEAVDCMWVVDGRSVPDDVDVVGGINGFKVYAGEARRLGLTAGFFFHSFKDKDHVQFRVQGSPADLFSIGTINQRMRTDFGE